MFQALDLEADEPGISVDEEGRYVPEKSMLTAWFRLNQVDPRTRDLYYNQIPERFKWNKSAGTWEWRQRQPSKTIGRLCNVDVRSSERFHLRLLLLNVKGAQSYDDLKKADGNEYATFAETCVALGLARDDSEWDNCMQDAAVWRMPRQLRRLFAMILALNSPKDPLKLWTNHRDALSEDFVRRHRYPQAQAYTAALFEVAEELRTYGKSLKDFPSLPQV